MTRRLLLALCLPLFLSHSAGAMLFRSELVQAQWDTWAYEHEGTYYLYYLITEHSPGEGFGVATSKDGVHWADHGWALRQSDQNSSYLGTGAVWKAVDFETSGRFLCNYSEHRRNANGRNIQNILFAWSTDLIHWTKYGDETMFQIDPESYAPLGRWDCIFPFPRAQGGYWGTWTATGKLVKGTVGIGYSQDGLHWVALPPPGVTPGVSESGAIYPIQGRYYAMFGAGGGMWAYSADQFTGPYLRAPRNAHLLDHGQTYFSRFLPTKKGLLVNHHSLSGLQIRTGRVVTYVAPFKRAELDAGNILRWRYWEGNEALKGRMLPARFEGTGVLRLYDGQLDMNVGIIVEGEVALPRPGDPPANLVFVVGPQHYAVRFLARGVVEMGTMDEAGGTWKKRFGVDREWEFGATARLRLLLRAGMMEIYLDDQFMECWTMGCHGEPQVRPGLFVSDATRPPVAHLQLWQMSLEPAKAPADARLGEMVKIPAGTFLMGNTGEEPNATEDEFPQHAVEVPAYGIGKYEVTRGEYRRFLEADGYENPSYWSAEGWKWKQQTGRREPAQWAAEQEWVSSPMH